MNARSICVKAALVLLALAVPRVWAQDGLKGALPWTSFTEPFAHGLAVGDFDNDKKLDGALLLDSAGLAARRIEVHFTGRVNTELTFESSERALTVTARDVDNDGDDDLVVEESFTHRPLHIWINEGHGDFHEGRVQDFPSLGLDTHQELHSPCAGTECLSLCLPPQPGFEVAILTVPLLGRPPSPGKAHTVLTAFFWVPCVHGPNSSRAPPPFS